ncbi:hypothetical protein, partial [Paracoccus sp. SSK6]|uniref:hypothetical protein n=1 Tax=Paracoccus sp. SSK6 TaxID=3143131 RepID=UPI003219A54C
SKPTFAELHNAFCKGLFGVNCYTVDRASREGEPVGRTNANADIEPQEIFAGIIQRDWTGTLYHQRIAGKLRVRSGNEFGPGGKLFKAAGFDHAVAPAPITWTEPEGRVVRGKWRADFAIDRVAA